MSATEQTVTVACPDCEYEIDLGTVPEKGQRVTCPECWASLEVVSLEPLELAWETEEEWNGDTE